MKTEKELKQIVKDTYSKAATQSMSFNASSCCGTTPASDQNLNIMMEDYTHLDGYNADADLGLGCGLPTNYALIKKGDTVIDLGSGAGNDCFVARHEVGDSGKVLGIDFTETMINKARENADKLGYNNVEFRYGDIDNMPVADNTANVVVSNCVLNLVPNKTKVIGEMFRVLKPGGHFSVSDIVLVGDLPEAITNEAEMYAGCVAGAIQKEDYLNTIDLAGFKNVKLQKEKPILLPDDILEKYMTKEELAQYKASETGIFSITVFGEKPESNNPTEKKKVSLTELQSEPAACCGPSGCC